MNSGCSGCKTNAGYELPPSKIVKSVDGSLHAPSPSRIIGLNVENDRQGRRIQFASTGTAIRDYRLYRTIAGKRGAMLISSGNLQRDIMTEVRDADSANDETPTYFLEIVDSAGRIVTAAVNVPGADL
ncbi:MAG: hypothetical protein JSS49_29230 [Planctomycetes bacterium]|nr:hypothetical protein [Planctomycetota bacterium]